MKFSYSDETDFYRNTVFRDFSYKNLNTFPGLVNQRVPNKKTFQHIVAKEQTPFPLCSEFINLMKESV